MDNFMIAILVILLTSLVSRKINQTANKKLNEDKKAKLVDLFSKSGMYSFGVLIVILALYFGNIKFQWVEIGASSSIFVIFILTFLIANAYTTYKKLKNNDFPDTYIKQNLLATSIRFLGLIFFFYILS